LNSAARAAVFVSSAAAKLDVVITSAHGRQHHIDGRRAAGGRAQADCDNAVRLIGGLARITLSVIFPG
jgi:hypothetical protein